MVAGGIGSTYTRLDSTEVYQDNEWRTVSGKLSRARSGMAITTIYDKIMLFGIYHIIL